MGHRLLWIHGIGNHAPGYSGPWQTNFERYLGLGAESYIEVLWEDVVDAAKGTTRGSPGAPAFALTPEEQAAEEDVRRELETMILARQSAADAAASPAVTRGGGGDMTVVEWSALGAAAETRGVGSWFLKPNDYLGDFIKYLVSRRVRNRIKEALKEHLRPLAGSEHRLSIVAHSWGTVVSYDSLHELSSEVPDLKVAGLVTLGSPLWMVRRFLDERSGEKPANLTSWLNIHARGDVIGSWIKPAFDADKDYEVPSTGDNAHSSYFRAENQQVQKDLVAPFILT